METKKININELDYLILACIVNSYETESYILDMAQRFLAMRFQCECSFPLNIQNPPAEQKNRKEK